MLARETIAKPNVCLAATQSSLSDNRRYYSRKERTVKIGIDSYCYHRFFGEVYGPQGEPNRRISYPDFLRRAVELKVDGVSLETCFFESFDDAYLQCLKEIIDEGHLEPVVAWGHPKGFEGGKAPQAMAELQSMFRVCHILGANVMRVVGSSLDYRNDPHEPQLKALTGIFREAAQMAEGEGVRLAVENHFDFTTDELADLIDRVNSAYFGMCFDTGNALRIGDDPVESVRLLSRHIYATHTKDVKPIYGVSPKEWYFFACVPVGQGVINMPGLIDALLATGYEGLFAIELDYVHPEVVDEDVAVAQSVKYLQGLKAARQ
jgi:3-oxoisoapionate decarboxylase